MILFSENRFLVKKEAIQLKDLAKMPSDIKQLDHDLDEVKNGWTNLQQISQAFTGDLQNSLVSSGRLIEAVENLEEWIMKVEPELSDLKQIDGDVFTVHNLIEQHRHVVNFIYLLRFMLETFNCHHKSECSKKSLTVRRRHLFNYVAWQVT